MTKEIVKGFKNLTSKFVQHLSEQMEKEKILLCPAGDMTKAIVESGLLSGNNIVGILDQSPKSNRFQLPEYHYNQLANLGANKIILCHMAYGDIISKNIMQYINEPGSIELINLSDYFITEFSLFIEHDALEYEKDNIVICKPRGGLNDMLSQIVLCWGYAIEHKRKLYVDTSKSGFLDCLSNYFEPSGRLNFGMPTGVNEATSIFPSALIGKIYDYDAVLHGYDSLYSTEQSEQYCYREKISGDKITFNFDKGYPEKILVHEQSGGGMHSICALANLKLKNTLSSNIKASIISLGDYSAAHIRNTDYQTDYKGFLLRLNEEVETKMLVCTDDHECKEFAKLLFGEKFVSVSNIPNTQGAPLHENKNINRSQANIDAITDLLVLASAKNIYNKPLDGLNNKAFDGEKLEKCTIESGFGLLAKALNKNKIVITNLLD